MVFRLPLVTVTVAALLAGVSGHDLRIKVSGPTSALGDIADLKITTILVNAGSEDVTLVKDPASILSPIQAQSFNIFHESGLVPQFTGIKFKYALDQAAKSPESTVTLAPGASIEVAHEIAGAYNLTRSGFGKYSISPSTQLFVVSPDGSVEAVHAVLQNTQSVSFASKARLAVAPKRAAEPSTLHKRASFTSCTTARQPLINTAVTNAKSYVAESLSYLNAHTASSTRFTTWFGTWSSARRTTAINQYTSLTKSDSFAAWTYDCACADGDSNTYAYVFANVYGTIHLCGQFWNAPATGTDSKAGTLVHESTHFTATAGTSDYAYGQTACKSLAISNPSRAILNADSHEYFSENNPSLT